MTNKLNLIFDFNNIAMRALFTCGYANGGDISTFDTDRECGVLIRKIAMDMAYVLRTFTPDRVIVACDAKHPWRNTLYDPDEDETYKGTRVKDNTKNWDKIWESLNEYKEILKQRGFVLTELPNAEADDVAALWKKTLFTEGNDNVILVSSDRDWVQLVDFNPVNNTFCLCFNPIANNKGQKKLYLTNDTETWLNNSVVAKVDIFFNNYNSVKDNIKNIKTKDNKINFELVDPNKVVLDKIMCGDDGDNAPAIYQYYKNGKKTRITATKAKKIFEDLNINTVKDLCEACEASSLKKEIESVLKKELDDIDMNERLMRQRKLVELNPILFPQEILDAYTYHCSHHENDGYMQTNEIKLDTILKDTKFLKEDYNKPKESSVFDNLKDLEKYIKPINGALF